MTSRKFPTALLVLLAIAIVVAIQGRHRTVHAQTAPGLGGGGAETENHSHPHFSAAGTGAGGVIAPALFGALIGTGDPHRLFWGYALGAGLMIGTAGIAAWLGVSAEGRSLEELTVSP